VAAGEPRLGTAGTDRSCGSGQGQQGEGFKVSVEDLEEVSYLGAGSSGIVKLVRHKGSGDLLVVKLIPFDVNDERVRRQVILELRLLHVASHEHVVRSHESFLDNGAIIIMMEYMDGGSLAAAFKARPEGVEERHLAEVARQCLLGLHYLHCDLRVIHRDIKPSNLLISTRGEVKIADFGVSGHLASNVSKCVSWVGTATYMSPERIKGDCYSFDSDLWSLGLTLLEGALGTFPYK
jgi:serine/threonine protein kinase